MKQQRSEMGCAVVVVLVTLLVVWILFQSTLSVITIRLPVALPSPVVQPVHQVSPHAKR